MTDGSCQPTGDLAPCTVQVLLCDADLRFARHVLPHQLRVLGHHAAEVLISVNRRPGDRPSPGLDELLGDLGRDVPQLRVVEVDHGPAGVDWVSRTFFGGGRYPLVDSKGTPFHAYLEPFRAVHQPFVLHLDSDMLIGGSGERWLAEAIDLLRDRPEFLAAKPCSGPPRDDGTFVSGGVEVPTPVGPARAVPAFTSRMFLVEVARLVEAVTPIPLHPPTERWRRLRARLLGFPDVDNVERLIGAAMRRQAMNRIDVGGSGQVWSLHPLHKTPSFVAALPRLIEQVESGDIPPAQQGHYNLHRSLLEQQDLPGRRQRADALVGALKRRRSAPTWSDRAPAST